MKVVLIFTLGLICGVLADDYSENEEWTDYRLVLNTPAPTHPSGVECQKPGTVCKDCNDVYLCNNVTGVWEPHWLETCDNGNSCNNGECTDTPTPECALEGENFKCVSIEGVYPDPGVCSKFYYCIPDGNALKKIPSSCGAKSGYGYNPRTTYCDIKLANNICGPPSIPICKKPAQTGVLKENPSMYYICTPLTQGSKALYPFLYICPNGRTYDGNYGCK